MGIRSGSVPLSWRLAGTSLGGAVSYLALAVEAAKRMPPGGLVRASRYMALAQAQLVHALADLPEECRDAAAQAGLAMAKAADAFPLEGDAAAWDETLRAAAWALRCCALPAAHIADLARRVTVMADLCTGGGNAGT